MHVRYLLDLMLLSITRRYRIVAALPTVLEKKVTALEY